MKNLQCFEKWHEYNREYLKNCGGKVLAMTFSAGKDSSVCLSFLSEVRKEYSFDLKAYLCAFPRHRYTDDVIKSLTGYWNTLGVELIAQYPDKGDEIMEGTENPCRPCQDVRKSMLPKVLSLTGRKPADTVIVSGHSLWDIAAYAVNRMIATKIAAAGSGGETSGDERLMEISQRFYPYFSMPEGFSVYRPLLFLNQPEIHAFCSGNSIPVIEQECRYSGWRPKNNLGAFFEKFGYSFTYEDVFNFAVDNLGIADLGRITSEDHTEYLVRRF